MNRTRKADRGLPRRVYKKHGAYYFVAAEPMRDPRDKKGVKPKAWIKLCAVDEGEVAMLRELAAVLGAPQLAEGSMPYCCTEFRARKLGNYTNETRETYMRYLAKISDEFEAFTAGDVTTKDCADFLRDHFSDKANTARKVANVLAKLFRFIIGELGLRQDNPMDQLDLGDYQTERREVLATHGQVAAIRAAGFVGVDGRPTQSGPMFACIIDMTYLLWARAIDIRNLKEAQIEGGIIRMKPSKTKNSSGLAINIAVSPEIAEVIERARAIKRANNLISPYLFPTRKGTPYAKTGLISMWDRARERAAAAAKKEGREFGEMIQFKDLRSLGATDAARSKVHRDEIQKRLVHTSGRTTDIYIKEAVPELSDLAIALPWANNQPQK